MRAERLTLHRRARRVEGTCATSEQSGRSALSASPPTLDDTELRTKAWWAMVVKSARERRGLARMPHAYMGGCDARRSGRARASLEMYDGLAVPAQRVAQAHL